MDFNKNPLLVAPKDNGLLRWYNYEQIYHSPLPPLLNIPDGIYIFVPRFRPIENLQGLAGLAGLYRSASDSVHSILSRQTSVGIENCLEIESRIEFLRSIDLMAYDDAVPAVIAVATPSFGELFDRVFRELRGER